MNYNVLTRLYLQVNGEPRKKHHKGKWEQVVQKATRSLQEMLRAASQRRRNVIIDQVGVASRKENIVKKILKPYSIDTF